MPKYNPVSLSRIEVRNLHKDYKIDGPLLKKIIRRITGLVKRPGGLRVEVVFLSDSKIKELNRRHKKEDCPTDVLSFGLRADELGKGTILGEIFISIDRARDNSKVFGAKFEDEVILYVIHGILHLCGYDDGSSKDRLKMRKEERRVLEYIWKKIDLSKVLTRL